MNYIFIFIAALFEVAWMFPLKFMKFSELKVLKWNNIFKPEIGFPIIWPFLGYLIFGLGNVYFFAIALKKVPASPAFAIWTTLSIIILKFAEIIFLKEKIAFVEIFFMLLITAGIVGLKVFSPN
jgi:quaternary ammonium compound-resistance protein SugE